MKELTIKQIQSQAITIIRFPLAVMVVCIHTYFVESLNLFGTEITMEGRMAPIIISLFSISLTHVAVPMFFAISGYLYFLNIKNFDKKIYFSKTKKRTVSILLPYFSWNVIALILSPSRISSLSLNDVLLGFWGQGEGLFPWNGPLWFLRDLMFVQLMVPLIYMTIKRTKYYVISLLFFLLIIGALPNVTIIGITSLSFIYFSIGAYIGIQHKEFYNKIYAKRTFFYIIYLFSILFDWYSVASRNLGYKLWLHSYSEYIHYLTIIFGIPSMFLIAAHIAKAQKFYHQFSILAVASMLIFCMHRLINSKISALGLFILGKESITSSEALIIYFSTIILTVVICIFIHFLIAKNKLIVKILEGKKLNHVYVK